MVRIVVTDRIFIEKDRLRLLEGHTMLAFVLEALLLVPLKADIAHKYIVRIVKVAVNEKDGQSLVSYHLLFPHTFRTTLQYFFSRTQKIKKIHTAIFARLANAKER